MPNMCINYDTSPPQETECSEHTWIERDARGIPLGGRVCENCFDEKMAKYRKQFKEDVFTNPNYETFEPIDPEGS